MELGAEMGLDELASKAQEQLAAVAEAPQRSWPPAGLRVRRGSTALTAAIPPS